MDTLSLVLKYLNGMEDILDDGNSMEARKLTIEKSKEKLELFEALDHKSVIVNEGSHRVVVFKKAPPRAYSRPFTSFSLPCDVGGQGAWDAELDMADSFNYITKERFDQLVIGYANEGEPSVFFGRDFLVTSKSRVDFRIGEMRIDLTMLEEIKEIDAKLDSLVENLEEVEIPTTSTIVPPSPIYHPLTQNKEKVKEVLDHKYKELEEPKPILEVLEIRDNHMWTGKINTVGANVNTAGAAVNTVIPVNTANIKAVNTVRSVNTAASKPIGNPQQKEYKDKAVIDSGCSRHMTGNKCYLDEYKYYDRGFVSFSDGKGRISSKGKIKTGSLDFDDVYFCKELKYNLFSVSQICDKKNNVLFTDTEYLVLSSNFKLLDEIQVLLRVPKKDNIHSVDLKSVVPTRGLTCLIAKATIDKSNTWRRRLGHINFKTMNKLIRGNLVKGLPLKIFANDHSCVACQKGKQHKASYKTKLVNSINKPLHMLHMDLFGPTNVKSLMKNSYCLVVTDDFSRFSWVFFFATKDETNGILKTFITEIENQLDHKVKVIKCDNGTEFKNSIMNQFSEMKGIKREFSVARTS
ncbi:putative ribonuclease H-like domain-containing protein [Tanacetum coccineum]